MRLLKIEKNLRRQQMSFENEMSIIFFEYNFLGRVGG